jgi:hypothetical protein
MARRAFEVAFINTIGTFGPNELVQNEPTDTKQAE